jgi:hypothetical protein
MECKCNPVRGVHAIFCPMNPRHTSLVGTRVTEDKPPPAPFVGIDRAVMQAAKCVAVACSHTFAKRIARALNKHEPNERGY